MSLRSIRFLRVDTGFPAWWPRWILRWRERLPTSDDPLGLKSPGLPHSAFLLDGPDSRPVPADAQALAASMAQIELKQSVPVNLHTVSAADMAKREIFVDTTILEHSPFRPSSPPLQKLDIALGFAIHEILHLEHSSPELCRKAARRGRLFKQIHNILEDEFIEGRLPQTAPGWAEYLHESRRYVFRDAFLSEVEHDDSLLQTFLLFVRYPALLNSPDIARYGEAFTGIHEILTPFPANPDAVYDAAARILRIFHWAAPLGPPPTAQLGEFLDWLANRSVPTTDPPGASERDGSPRSTPKEPTGVLRLPKAVVWESPPNDPATYRSDLSRVRRHVRQLRRRIENRPSAERKVVRGRESGSLDRGRLPRVGSGSLRIFQKGQTIAGNDTVTLALLIDESGSMNTDKIAAARRVAILFREALWDSPRIQFSIFGHSADIPDGLNTMIYRYWQPGWPRRFSLGSVQARRNNRDGHAIRIVGEELIRTAVNPARVLIVISDGQPSADQYEGKRAVAHTRSAVVELQNKGVHVIQIAIDPDVESERMFDHYIRLTDLGRLPGEMTRLLERLLR